MSFTHKQVIEWIGRNNFGGSLKAARTAMDDARSLPIRVRLSREAGWRMPPNTIKVCRPGMWGNPFMVSGDFTNVQAVEMYEAWLGSADWDLWLAHHHREHWLRTQNAPNRLRALLDELRGHNLACWCHHGSPCHADTLLNLANAAASESRAPGETPPSTKVE